MRPTMLSTTQDDQGAEAPAGGGGQQDPVPVRAAGRSRQEMKGVGAPHPLGCPKKNIIWNFDGLTLYSYLYGYKMIPCKISGPYLNF